TRPIRHDANNDWILAGRIAHPAFSNERIPALHLQKAKRLLASRVCDSKERTRSVSTENGGILRQRRTWYLGSRLSRQWVAHEIFGGKRIIWLGLQDDFVS